MEPELTLTFDLTLTQTDKVRNTRATVTTPNPSINIMAPLTTVDTISAPYSPSQASGSATSIVALLATHRATPQSLFDSFISPAPMNLT
jgi:hypothetical protein